MLFRGACNHFSILPSKRYVYILGVFDLLTLIYTSKYGGCVAIGEKSLAYLNRLNMVYNLFYENYVSLLGTNIYLQVFKTVL